MSLQIKEMVSETDPVSRAYENEYSHIFLSFCSYICLIHNKKMNLANIFLCLLKSPHLRETFKMLCDIETDYDALMYFLKYDPTLHRSKYIRNYLQTDPDMQLKW